MDDVEAWIHRAPENVHFLVDEAYFEFVDSASYRSLDALALENPNVVVARTFSKVYGMAGIRLGYGIAHPETARALQGFCRRHQLQPPGAGGWPGSPCRRGLGGKECRSKPREPAGAYGVLDELGLEYLPSHTNFVMHRISGDLRAVHQPHGEAGIRVGRPFPPMLDFNRSPSASRRRWSGTPKR